MRVVWLLAVFLLLGALTLLMPGGATREAAPRQMCRPLPHPGPRKRGGEEAVAEEAKEEGHKEAGKAEEEKGVECPNTFGPILTDTAVPIDKGKLAIQPTFSLGFLTSIFNRNWRPVSAGGNFTTFQGNVRFTYGLINNMEVYVLIPYVQRWVSDVDVPGPRGSGRHTFGGLGDIDLTVKYRLVEEGQRMPTVTALFATDFPTGHFNHLNPRFLGADAIGGGSYIFTTGFNVSKCLDRFVLYGNFWYSMSTAFTDDNIAGAIPGTSSPSTWPASMSSAKIRSGWPSSSSPTSGTAAASSAGRPMCRPRP